MQKEPNLVIKSKPLDFELCELLGEKSADFLVLCADGDLVPFTGTPFDSPVERQKYTQFVDFLNDRSDKSWWPEFFANWKNQFCKHYGLAPETTYRDYHPKFSFVVSRSCVGYSEHLHCAIQLFDQLAAHIESWSICRADTGINVVKIKSKRGTLYIQAGEKMSVVITEAVKRLMQNDQKH